MMKLQLWTAVNGEADELLGEVDVDEWQWTGAQTNAADAAELIADLATGGVG